MQRLHAALEVGHLGAREPLRGFGLRGQQRGYHDILDWIGPSGDGDRDHTLRRRATGTVAHKRERVRTEVVVCRCVRDLGAVGHRDAMGRGRDNRNTGRREAVEQAARQIQRHRRIERHRHYTCQRRRHADAERHYTTSWPDNIGCGQSSGVGAGCHRCTRDHAATGVEDQTRWQSGRAITQDRGIGSDDLYGRNRSASRHAGKSRAGYGRRVARVDSEYQYQRRTCAGCIGGSQTRVKRPAGRRRPCNRASAAVQSQSSRQNTGCRDCVGNDRAVGGSDLVTGKNRVSGCVGCVGTGDRGNRAWIDADRDSRGATCACGIGGTQNNGEVATLRGSSR